MQILVLVVAWPLSQFRQLSALRFAAAIGQRCSCAPRCRVLTRRRDPHSAIGAGTALLLALVVAITTDYFSACSHDATLVRAASHGQRQQQQQQPPLCFVEAVQQGALWQAASFVNVTCCEIAVVRSPVVGSLS